MTNKTVVVRDRCITPLAANRPGDVGGAARRQSPASPASRPRYAELELPVEFAGQARRFLTDQLTRPESKRLDPSSQLSLVAAREAWADAGIDAESVVPERLIRRLGHRHRRRQHAARRLGTPCARWARVASCR